MRNAGARSWPFLLISERAARTHEPLTELAICPPGLTSRHPVAMAHLRPRHTRHMFAAPTPLLPRAWDPTHAYGHHAPLYAHLSRVEYVAAMRRVFKSARHVTIPPRIQDVLYKTLVSGHMLGEHNAWRRGNSHMCARCGTCVESLAHAYAECKDVGGLWDLVLDRWEVATSERLDPRDRRVTLLGDRGETDLATSRGCGGSCMLLRHG